MRRKQVYDNEGHAHYITFSTDLKRPLLNRDEAKGIMLNTLSTELSLHEGRCYGFVIMPDHVHVIVHFAQENTVSAFMRGWKRKSSWYLRKFFEAECSTYAESFSESTRLWRPRFYDFNLFSEEKFVEKLNYIHANPVRASLVETPSAWRWSSARWYECGESIGVPIG